MTHSYSLNLADEVKKGMTEKALRGELQTPAPYGYVIKDGALALETVQSEVVKTIFNLYVYENMSSAEIAKRLNDLGIFTKHGNRFQKRSVDYILKNPVYAGKIRWSPQRKANYLAETPEYAIIAKGFHSAIIDEDTYELAARKAPSEHKRTKTKGNGHYLQGILKCMRCGGNMYLCGKIFRCGNYLNKKCEFSQGVSAAKVEKLITDAIPDFKKNVATTDIKEIVQTVYFDKALWTVDVSLT